MSCVCQPMTNCALPQRDWNLPCWLKRTLVRLCVVNLCLRHSGYGHVIWMRRMDWCDDHDTSWKIVADDEAVHTADFWRQQTNQPTPIVMMLKMVVRFWQAAFMLMLGMKEMVLGKKLRKPHVIISRYIVCSFLLQHDRTTIVGMFCWWRRWWFHVMMMKLCRYDGARAPRVELVEYILMCFGDLMTKGYPDAMCSFMFIFDHAWWVHAKWWCRW